MDKDQLRSEYLKKRKALSLEERDALSFDIVNKCLSLPLWEALTFHLFLPIEKQAEIDTTILLTLLQGKDKQVILSKMSPEKELIHFLLTEQTRIREGKWGVPEPDGGLAITTNQIEVVFVPLIIFDRIGHRVGYGKGYYDRFLSQCSPNTIKVGLSFFEAVDKIVSTANHDIALDYCITPKKVYTF